MKKMKHEEEFFMLGDEEEDRRYFLHNKKRFDLVLKEIDKKFKKNRNMSLLDIGTSPLTFLIKKKYPKIKLTSLDYSSNFENECKKKGIFFIQQDLNKTANKLKANCYDMILFLEVIEHLKGNNILVLNNLIRALKPRGIIIIQTPNKNSLKTLVLKIISEKSWDKLSSAPKVTEEFNHFKEYDFEELETILKNLKNATVLDAERPLYFDYPESTLVYRKNKMIFSPLMYLYFLIVTTFPNFRRGMYFKLAKV